MTSKKFCNNGHNAGNSKLVAPDGGWGWIVATASFLAGFLIGATGVLFSLILDYLLIAMDTTTATASWILSAQFFTTMLSAPFATAFSLRFSYRKTAFAGGLVYFTALLTSFFVQRIELLILTLGALIGFGGAFSFTAVFLAINDYFDKRRGRVIGILLSAMPFGRFCFALILQTALNTYGFRGTILLTSAFMLNICVCASFLQPVSWHLKASKDGQKQSIQSNDSTKIADKPSTKCPFLTESAKPKEETAETRLTTVNNDQPDGSLPTKRTLWQRFCSAMRLDFTVLENPCFYILCASHILYMCTFPYVNSFLPSLGETKGYEPFIAASLLSCLALCEIFGQLLAPWIIDLKLLKIRTVMMIGSFCFGTLLWVITTSSIYYVDAVICGFGGLLQGGTGAANMIALAKVLGPQKLPSVMAFTQFFQSFFVLIMGPLLGFARDYTGNFEVIFVTLSCIQYFTVFVWLLEPLAKRRALRLKK